jgi:hypothetical protein
MNEGGSVMFKRTTLAMTVLVALGIGWTPASAAPSPKIGFLVVAPDRGFLREDWPKEREKAVAAFRAAIEESGQHERALVIANRLYGSGPHRTMLKGLSYEMSDTGLVDLVLTRWLEDRLTRVTTELIPSQG